MHDNMSPVSTVCVFVLLANILTTTHAQAHPEVVILLTERHTLLAPGSVHRWDLYGDRLRLHPLSNITTPTAIDYDNVTRRIYWTDISREEIRSAELTSGDNTLVAKLNSISYPEGLTVDGSAGKIFYTDRGNKVIVSINFNGFARTTIVSSNISYPQGIVADKSDRKLYWVDHLTNTINSCNYDGGGRGTLVSTDIYAPMGITMNENTGRLYWCEYNGNVYSIQKDGTNRKTHYRDIVTKPHFMDIAVFNGFLYIVDRTNRNILVIPENDKATHTATLSSGSFKTITGIHVFSPNSMETGCADGRYGAGCTSVCGRCSGGVFLCEKTTGSCLGGCVAGYKGNICTQACLGTYGKGCSSSCGHCQIGTTCHHETGQCPSGCQSGWTGNMCQEKELMEDSIFITEGENERQHFAFWRSCRMVEGVSGEILWQERTPLVIVNGNLTAQR